jgi:sugar lactone lactonase YvrE
VNVATGDVETVVPLDGPVQAPDDLAFAADGTMYITDLTPGRVWSRTPKGEYALVTDAVQVPNGVTCVGNRVFVNEMKSKGRLLELFPDGSAPRVVVSSLDWGNAMQPGPGGYLYYPSMIAGQIWRVSPDGSVPELVVDQLNAPVAAHFDRRGTLVVLSHGAEGVITRIRLDTGARTVLTTGIEGLDNMAFDDDNRMYVSSYSGGGITEVKADGRSREIVRQGFDGPYGVTADHTGRVFAGDHYRLAGPRPARRGHEGLITYAMENFVHGVAAGNGLLHITSQVGDVRTHDPERGTTRVRATGLNEPMGIAVAADGSVLVAESGAGRVLRIDDDNAVTVLAHGLAHPVDVAVDSFGRCYVSDDRLGAVLRIDEGRAVTVAGDLGAPQGLTVQNDNLFVLETEHKHLRSVSLATGRSRVEAHRLAVGLPPGIKRAEPDPNPTPFARPRQFAGLATGAAGSLLVSANGEGSILLLRPRTGH